MLIFCVNNAVGAHRVKHPHMKRLSELELRVRLQIRCFFFSKWWQLGLESALSDLNVETHSHFLPTKVGQADKKDRKNKIETLSNCDPFPQEVGSLLLFALMQPMRR